MISHFGRSVRASAIVLIVLLLTGTVAWPLEWEYLGTPHQTNPLEFYFLPDGTVLLQTRNTDSVITKSAGVETINALERYAGSGTWSIVHTVKEEHAMRVEVLDSGIVIAGYHNQIARSTDSGFSWKENENSLSFIVLHTIEVSPDGILFSGAYSNNYRSDDSGLTWQAIDLPYQGRKYIFLDNGVILAGVFLGSWPDPPSYLYRSEDTGNTWSEILEFPSMLRSFYSAVSPAGYVYFAVASYSDCKLYRSDDTGITWMPIEDGLPDGITGLSLYDDATVFVSIEDDGLYRTTDSGNTWEHVTALLPSQTTGAPVVTPDGTLYLTVSGNGIYKSDTIGDSWESVTGKEMEDILVFDCSPDGTLYAATGNNAVYRASTSPLIVGSESNPQPFLTVSPATPNPFNPSTTISYTIAEEGHVTLSVYSLSGQKVATLVDSPMPAGTHQAVFDGTGLASGLYVYRLESGDVVKSGKMMLVK